MKKELLREYNKKLGKQTVTFNLSSATDCISKKKGLCKNKNFCYAMKSERQYKQVLSYRRRQNKYWYNTQISQIIKDFKEYYKNKRKKPKYLRINESGDIKKEDIKKIIKIAEEFQELIIYLYTARYDLADEIKNMKKPKNLIVNGSNFMLDNEFRVIFKDDLKNLNRYSKVCIANCTNCKQCMIKAHQTIYVLKH